MSDEIECRIISMFGLGMSYLDIAGHISEIYGLDVSNATISAITDKLIPEIKLCGRYASKAVYTVPGLE